MTEKGFKKLAFTLAEVLITLGIIGIVAEMTIPTLAQNINNSIYYTQFMTTYSLLNQASSLIITDSGGDFTGQYPDTTTLMNAFAGKLKTLKTCAEGSATNCWTNSDLNLLSKKMSYTLGANDSAMILANGAIVRFSTTGGDFSASCQAINNYYIKNGTTYHACDAIWVDVNGNKSPNELGRDVYLLLIYPTLPIIPDGMPGTEDYTSFTDFVGGCDVTATWTGFTCAARLVYEKKMNY